MADSVHTTGAPKIDRRKALKTLSFAAGTVALPTAVEASPGQELPSEIIRLGAQLHEAIEHASEAALIARPLFKAWSEARDGKALSVEDEAKLPEYAPYSRASVEWHTRMEVALAIADRLETMRPTTMHELLIVMRAHAYAWGTEGLSDGLSLFSDTEAAQLLDFGSEAASGA